MFTQLKHRQSWLKGKSVEEGHKVCDSRNNGDEHIAMEWGNILIEFFLKCAKQCLAQWEHLNVTTVVIILFLLTLCWQSMSMKSSNLTGASAAFNRSCCIYFIPFSHWTSQWYTPEDGVLLQKKSVALENQWRLQFLIFPTQNLQPTLTTAHGFRQSWGQPPFIRTKRQETCGIHLFVFKSPSFWSKASLWSTKN